MSDRKKIWVEAGLTEFARFGPDGFKVENMAARVNKSRSSYYHLFGDMEGFRDAVYEYYWEYTQRIAQLLESAESFHPDFTNIISEHKDWAFTHINMYHHRDHCDKCGIYFTKGTALIEHKICSLWAQSVGLSDQPIDKVIDLFRIVREAIFTKMHYDTFDPDKMYADMKVFNESLKFLHTDYGS